MGAKANYSYSENREGPSLSPATVVPLVFGTLMVLAFSAFSAYAQEAVPGDACTGAESGFSQITAEASPSTISHLITCDGTNWLKVFSFDRSNGFFQPQFTNTSSCNDGDTLTYSAATGGITCGIPDPCETGAIGTRCTSDDAIYAGDVGGNRIYAAPCDHGMSWNGTTCTGSQIRRQWKTSTTATSGTTSLSDGVANTDAMATAGIALHPAAEACRNAGSEWYLPARDELDLLYDSLVDQNGDSTPGGPLSSTFNFNTIGGIDPNGFYWSSSEFDSAFTWDQRFSDGAQGNNFKSSSIAVRCVRR